MKIFIIKIIVRPINNLPFLVLQKLNLQGNSSNKSTFHKFLLKSLQNLNLLQNEKEKITFLINIKTNPLKNNFFQNRFFQSGFPSTRKINKINLINPKFGLIRRKKNLVSYLYFSNAIPFNIFITNKNTYIKIFTNLNKNPLNVPSKFMKTYNVFTQEDKIYRQLSINKKEQLESSKTFRQLAFKSKNRFFSEILKNADKPKWNKKYEANNNSQILTFLPLTQKKEMTSPIKSFKAKKIIKNIELQNYTKVFSLKLPLDEETILHIRMIKDNFYAKIFTNLQNFPKLLQNLPSLSQEITNLGFNTTVVKLIPSNNKNQNNQRGEKYDSSKTTLEKTTSNINEVYTSFNFYL